MVDVNGIVQNVIIAICYLSVIAFQYYFHRKDKQDSVRFEKKWDDEIKKQDESVRTDKRKMITDLLDMISEQRYISVPQYRLLKSAYRDYTSRGGNHDVTVMFNLCMEYDVKDSKGNTISKEQLDREIL